MEKNAKDYIMEEIENQWCPGCGNFAFHGIIREALADLGKDPTQMVFCSGIGQAAKLPQYTKAHMFNGLHGRSLPIALAVKSSNPELDVFAYSGDGCSYGEGGNHFIHQICRNPDITHFISDNQIYGLTKGQGSPTSSPGMKTSVQVYGVTNKPFNPLSVAISLGATFVARIFVGDKEKSVEIVKQAIEHKGYAIVDGFSPCVSFNKFNTYKWYKDHTYYLDEEHDPTDYNQAFARAMEEGEYPLGIFYKKNDEKVFWEKSHAYDEDKRPLYRREVDKQKLKKLIESKRTR